MKFRLDARMMKVIVCLVAVLILFLGGMLLLRAWEEDRFGAAPESTDEEETEQALTYYDGAWYAPRTDLETVLVLGIDKYAEDQSLDVQGEYEQSDFLMLLLLDKTARTCAAIHINRDTMTEYEQLTDSGLTAGTVVGQITLAHAYGGDGTMRCRNSVRAVSNLLYGVDIDHYISIAMDGVVVLNDFVGGVTVEVMDDFTGIDDTLVQGETVTLLGRHALTYVRTRYGLEDSSNLHRMERQRQYLEALQTALAARAEEDENFLTDALLAVNDYLVSDCTVQQLSDISEMVGDWGVGEYITLEGEAVLNGIHMEFYPDEDALQRLVMERFYEWVEDD